MGQRNRNIFRRKGMEEFGKKTDGRVFHYTELLDFLNSYKNSSGRTHRGMSIDNHELISLLVRTPTFKRVDKHKYKYIGETEDVMD